MSVPIAVTGLTPKRKISSGVIRVPPPMPVMPTIAPMPKPNRTIAGSIGSGAPHGADFDFPDLLGQECGVRQDTRMEIELGGVAHSYGDLQTLASIDLEAAPHSVVGLVGPSACGK